MEISLDNVAIFKGEIQKSQGTLAGAENYAECILFTVDDSALMKIEKFDAENYPSLEEATVEQDEMRTFRIMILMILASPSTNKQVRPKTASRDVDSSDNSPIASAFNPDAHFQKMNPNSRPMTSAITKKGNNSFTRF